MPRDSPRIARIPTTIPASAAEVVAGFVATFSSLLRLLGGDDFAAALQQLTQCAPPKFTQSYIPAEQQNYCNEISRRADEACVENSPPQPIDNQNIPQAYHNAIFRQITVLPRLIPRGLFFKGAEKGGIIRGGTIRGMGDYFFEVQFCYCVIVVSHGISRFSPCSIIDNKAA